MAADKMIDLMLSFSVGCEDHSSSMGLAPRHRPLRRALTTVARSVALFASQVAIIASQQVSASFRIRFVAAEDHVFIVNFPVGLLVSGLLRAFPAAAFVFP